jgi:hypothetical protein
MWQSADLRFYLIRRFVICGFTVFEDPAIIEDLRDLQIRKYILFLLPNIAYTANLNLYKLKNASKDGF